MDKSTTRDVLHFVAYKEAQGMWVAVGLEVFIVAQAESFGELPSAVEHLLEGAAVTAEKTGKPLFHGLKSAPRKYWDLFSKAESLPPFRDVRLPPAEVPLAAAELKLFYPAAA